VVVRIGFGLRTGVRIGLEEGSSFGCSMAVVRTFVALFYLSCYLGSRVWCIYLAGRLVELEYGLLV
jgi:hypothetical protein